MVDPTQLQDPTDDDAVDFSQMEEEVRGTSGRQQPPKQDAFASFRRSHCQRSNESFPHTCNKIRSFREEPQRGDKESEEKPSLRGQVFEDEQQSIDALVQLFFEGPYEKMMEQIRKHTDQFWKDKLGQKGSREANRDQQAQSGSLSFDQKFEVEERLRPLLTSLSEQQLHKFDDEFRAQALYHLEDEFWLETEDCRSKMDTLAEQFTRDHKLQMAKKKQYTLAISDSIEEVGSYLSSMPLVQNVFGIAPVNSPEAISQRLESSLNDLVLNHCYTRYREL